MSEHSGKQSFAEQRAAETLEKQAHAIAEAVVAVSPENSATNPLEIFPEPGERRADTEFNLPPEQEKAFREAMAKLGIGRETNLTATEIGLKDGYIAIIEGGQAHKMVAELNVVLSDKDTRPSAIIIAATPERAIPSLEADKAKERETTARVLNIDVESAGPTEYDIAQLVAYKIPGMQPRPVSILEFEYDMDGKIKTENATGQLKHLGSVNHIIPIHLLRVDREYPDPDNRREYRTLGPKNLIKVIDRWLKHLPESEGREVGFVTSATYQPSREIDATSAMLEIEREGGLRNVGVITYGTRNLAEVKKETYPKPPALGQLAGEAHNAAKQLEVLRTLIGS